MRGWEKQPGESEKAYEAFSLYRDMGPSRSLAKVGQALGKSTALMERWSSQHDWQDRVESLRVRDEMIRREAVEEALRSEAEGLARRRAALEEKLLEARERAADQAIAMLAYPIARLTNTTTSEDGAVVHNTFEAARWSKATIASLVAVAAGRHMPQGEPDDEPEDSGGFDPVALEAMSEEELLLAEKLWLRMLRRDPDDDGLPGVPS
jgi:hypothetical protein